MSKLLATVLTVVFLLCAVPSGAADLRIATEGAYPPFNFRDANGKVTGFDVDIAHALCKAMDKSCTVVAVPWATILDGLQAGDYDMVVASMARTPEREKVADFTNSYYRSRTAFVGRKELKDVAIPEGLRGLTLATQVDTVQAQYLASHFKDSATVRLPEKLEQALDLLVAGKVDAVLSDSLTIYDFLVSERGGPFDFVGEALPAEHVASTAHIAVRKGDDALRTAIDKALVELRLSGVYDRINRKYFPFSIY